MQIWKDIQDIVLSEKQQLVKQMYHASICI